MTVQATPISKQTRRCVAWQGWKLDLPARWNPVKIDGDFEKGSVLFADLHRARLGMRWRRVGKKFDADAWMKRAMRDEVGSLAAEAASPVDHGLLYVDPEPPGRDVWMGFSDESRRVLEIVYHSHRRGRVLQDAILPTLCDRDDGAWAIFDLSCRVDPRMKLTEHRLNAGDLMLRFGDVVIRQIALAEIALRRMPLEKWLAQHQRLHARHHRGGERSSEGVAATMRRRRRFAWMRWIPAEIFTCALHDAAHDKLLLLSAPDRAAVEALATTIGWADA